jgi:hypothetical protein
MNLLSDWLYKEQDLLFQRFNYFLVSMSFLLAAFVTLIVVKDFEKTPSLLWIAGIIAGLGILLSLIFAYTDYLNSRVIKNMVSDNSDKDINSVKTLNNLATDSWKKEISRCCWPFRIIIALWPFGEEAIGLSWHTYAIPTLFFIVWIVLIFVAFLVK